jgi:hypothetical protein
VSIALWVPAVCSTSAWFYYDNKGIWALIMAQVCEIALDDVLFLVMLMYFLMIDRAGDVCG